MEIRTTFKVRFSVNNACAHCLKITQNVAFIFLILAFSTKFCPIITDMSGNTVWPQASGFQKLAKMDRFLASLTMLNETFSVIFKHRALNEVFFLQD